MSSEDRGGGDGKPNRLRFRLGQIRVTIDLPSVAGKGRQMLSNWLLFTKAELAILRLLADGRARSREEIARELGESPEGKLKGLLANLGDRLCITVRPDGYRINAHDDELPELRRALGSLEGGQ